MSNDYAIAYNLQQTLSETSVDCYNACMQRVIRYITNDIYTKKVGILLVSLALLNTILLIYPNYLFECADNTCGLSMVDTYFHDALWHVGISASSFKQFPYRMPIFSGYSLQGYHYLFDWMIFIFGTMGIPYLLLYWWISPILYTCLMTYLCIKLGNKISDNPLFTGILLFFIYFAGTFSFIANLIMKGSAFGYGVSSLAHASTTVLYPTVAYSYCLIVGVMIVLMKKKLIFRDHIILGILLFICMGIKFYAGITLMIMLGVFELLQCFQLWSKSKIHFFHVITTTVATLLVYALFLILALLVFYEFPRSLQHEAVFSWAPLASVHGVIEDPYIYGMADLVLARQTLYAHGISPRLIAIESFSIVLFLFHHFGTRLLGLVFLTWLLFKKRANKIDIASWIAVVVTTFLSMVLVQRGEQWWNSMQFLYYATFLSAIYTARFIYELTKSYKKYRLVILIVIFFLTIPNTLEKVQEMYKTKKRAISYAELEALSFLKKKSDGLVLSVPMMPDTAYIAAFTSKQTYFSDEQMLRNTGVSFQKRKEYLLKKEDIDLNFVKARYIYMIKSAVEYPLLLRKAKETGYIFVFKNKEIVIMEKRI